MRRLSWECYYPDFEDNRAKHAVDPQSAMSVMLKPPSAAVWRRFFTLVAQHPKIGPMLAEKAAELKNIALATGLIIQFATLYDELAECLYLSCVGKFSRFVLDDGTVVEDGAQHWALRDEIEGADLYQDILKALIQRTYLEEGVANFLASGSGPPLSAATANPSHDGTVENVAVPA